jgi:hypothetical protein
MANSIVQSESFTPVGGSSTHVLLEFPTMGEGFLYMGSAITVSYSVYRSKTPVFNCGNSLIDGFAIGHKYVAGSIVSTMFLKDELSDFIQKNNDIEEIKNSEYAVYSENLMRKQSLKEIHTSMKDDIAAFNMHIIFTSEYSLKATRIIIYDATFINNGQVMSVNDIITEGTLSFVARDIREQHDMNDSFKSISYRQTTLKASDLV